MAVHTKIRKVFDDQNSCIYELSSDLVNKNCFATINKSNQIIYFHTQKTDGRPIFTYELNNAEDKKMPADKEYRLLIIHTLQKLIPAIKKGIFPQYLDKCS